MDAFWPGPLTLVLPALSVVPKEVTAGLGTVALRMPDHPAALALIEAAGCPVAAPSANLSGRPSPTDAESVAADLGGRVDLILDAGNVEIGLESMVVDLTGSKPLLLRPGGMPPEMLERFLGERLNVPGEAGKDAERHSPGTRHRHYAPAVPVVVWEGGEIPAAVEPLSAGCVGLTPPPAGVGGVGLFGSEENYARGIFAAFRSLEAREGCRCIVAEWPPRPDGLGLALRDRIRRASEKEKKRGNPNNSGYN
jgi:L-threonylcarbamoyladenylate synthase